MVRTQPVQLLFETVVPETPGGSGPAVRQLSQHRYLVAGYVAPAGQSTDGLLVWVDSGGSVVRQRRFGGDGNDYLWDAHELSDGRIFLDFNYAYNPYCAYNDDWSCPLPPAENRLDVAIRAGEKTFHAEE